MKLEMPPEVRRKLVNVLLGLVPVITSHEMAKLAGIAPGAVVLIPYASLEKMADAMRELNLMIYGPHDETRPV